MTLVLLLPLPGLGVGEDVEEGMRLTEFEFDVSVVVAVLEFDVSVLVAVLVVRLATTLSVSCYVLPI